MITTKIPTREKKGQQAARGQSDASAFYGLELYRNYILDMIGTESASTEGKQQKVWKLGQNPFDAFRKIR